MNILQTEYVIFDVETTGLSPDEGDRIVEIAAVKFKGEEIIEEFDSLVNPERDIPFGAQRIHNITNEMVDDAPQRSEVLPKVIGFIGNACLVGHNIKFDLDFLCSELAQIGRKLKDETPAVDTLKMAKFLLPPIRSYSLSSVAMNLGATVNETHRALADVKLTCAVLKHLLNKAVEQKMDKFPEFVGKFGVPKPNFKIEQLNQDSLF